MEIDIKRICSKIIRDNFDRISQYSIQLFHNDVPNWESSPPEPIGTGVLIKHENNHFIVSAAHVLQPYGTKQKRNPYRDESDYDNPLGAFLSLENIGFYAPWSLYIDKGTIIGDNALLDARRRLQIGKNVNLSSNVSIYTQQHDHRDPYFACPNPQNKKMSVEIDDRAWLGSNVIVLPGVHIGEGAVCCAGCVVTKDVEPYAVVAGIPAKKVGERPQVLKYEFDGKSGRLY